MLVDCLLLVSLAELLLLYYLLQTFQYYSHPYSSIFDMWQKKKHEHECEHARKIETHDHSSSWQKSFLCGSFAGAVQALVICPTEHVKCRLQTQHAIVGYKQTVYKGAFDAFDKILNSHGLRGLFRGFGCTAWREIPSFGLYFSTYDFAKDSVSGMLSSSKQRQYDGNDESADSLHMWAASSLAGGFSGALVVSNTFLHLLLIVLPTERIHNLMHSFCCCGPFSG